MMIKPLNEHDWLAVLADPNVDLNVSIHHGYRISPNDWDSGMRELEWNLLHLTTQGIQTMTVDGIVHSLQSGSAFLMGQGVRHQLINPDGSGNYFIRFHVHKGPTFYRPEHWCVLHNRIDVSAMYSRILREVDVETAYSGWGLRSAFLQVMLELFRGRSRLGGTTFSPTEQQQINEFIVQNFDSSPRELADEMGMTADYFTRVFRRTYGVPPRKRILQERIRLAGLRLLETTETVQEVAFAFGYRNPYLFSRQFRNVMGMSPTEYRRRGAD